MRGLFVTAIGTDCGKTHASCALLRELAAKPPPPLAIKPLMSGFAPADLAGSDAGRLLAACGQPATAEAIAGICYKHFEEPSAPNVAARRAGVVLDYQEMLDFVRNRIAATDGPFLVEGAGGVMSPLTDDCTNLDLMADLDLPVLLLACNYLGAVSHTLTALDVLQRRGLRTVALVVSQPWPHAGPADVFADELARWTSTPIIIAPFAKLPADDRAWAAPLAARLFS
jgi:dethiobiotin synthetase